MMLANNLRRGMHFKYFSPIKDGKEWVVWYYRDVRKEILENTNVEEKK